jgi:hypothetical protein
MIRKLENIDPVSGCRGRVIPLPAEFLQYFLPILAAEFAKMELRVYLCFRRRDIIFNVLCNIIFPTSIKVCTRRVYFVVELLRDL